MAFILHDEAELWVLQVLLTKEDTVPANFYLGLCNDTLVKTDGLSDISGEPSGDGYTRQAIPASAVGWTISVDGIYRKGTAAAKTFTADGGDWGTVNTWFVATSSDNSGTLICSGPIDPARVIGDGDSLEQTAYLRIKFEGES